MQLSIGYDPFYRSIVTINGIRYAEELFTEFGLGVTRPGFAFRIIKKEDGILTIEQREAEWPAA